MLDTVLIGIQVHGSAFNWSERRSWWTSFHFEDARVLSLERSVRSEWWRNLLLSMLFILLQIYCLGYSGIWNVISLHVLWFFHKLLKQIGRVFVIKYIYRRQLTSCVFVCNRSNWSFNLIGNRWVDANWSLAEAKLDFFILVPWSMVDVPRTDGWPNWVHHDVLILWVSLFGHWMSLVTNKTKTLVDTACVFLQVLVFRRLPVQIDNHLLESIDALFPLLEELRIVNGNI